VAVLDSQTITFTIDSGDFKPMADKTLTVESIAKDGLTVEQIPAALQEIAAGKLSIQASLDAKDTEEGEKKGGDEEEEMGEDGEHKYRNLEQDEENEEGEKGEDAEEEKGEDQENEEESEGKDSASALDARVTRLEKGSRRAGSVNPFKTIVREMGQRDSLYDKVSPFIGAFDHAEMSTKDLAVYACDKLKLKPTKGHEVTALKAYLTNRPRPTAFGQDRGQSSGSGTGLMDTYFKGAEAN